MARKQAGDLNDDAFRAQVAALITYLKVPTSSEASQPGVNFETLRKLAHEPSRTRDGDVVKSDKRRMSELDQERKAAGMERNIVQAVERIVRSADLWAEQKRRFRFTMDSTQTLALVPNLPQRSFEVVQIDRVWLSDFTELPCRNGKAYALAIMDLCSRRILGVTVSYTMQTQTLMHALDQACKLRKTLPKEPLIFHSDRGSQYNADTFKTDGTELAECNIRQSMSGVGNCYDNAPIEWFWSRMKHALRHDALFDDLHKPRTAVY